MTHHDIDRNTGIGGSDVPAILGLSPYRSAVELWAEKRGQGQQQEPNLAMRIGTLVEDAIATLYAESKGVKVRRSPTFKPRRAVFVAGEPRIVGYPAMAHIDRRIVGGHGLEVKHTGTFDRFTDTLPDDVAVQVQHYLMVTGWPAFDVVVLVGGRDLKTYTVEPDRDAQEAIVEACEAFWRCVETGEQPPIDGSEGSSNWLKSRFPRDDGSELVATHSMLPLLDELVAAKAAVKDAERAYDLAANRVKEVMGEHAALLSPVARVTWREQERSTVAWPEVIEALKDAYGIPRQTIDDATYDATTKKTIRVFLVSPAKE